MTQESKKKKNVCLTRMENVCCSTTFNKQKKKIVRVK